VVLVKLAFLLSGLPMIVGLFMAANRTSRKVVTDLSCCLGWPLNHPGLSTLGDVMLKIRYAVTEWFETSETYVWHVIEVVTARP